ncbi:MAG: thiamine pyrophosphate-binding protein [Thermodesulfobacteriota bacterium]
MTVADMILRYLENEGVEYVFGISGAALNNFLVAFNRNPRIKTVVTKHEGGAAYMADGYARVRGGLGACFATSGPGATNLVTGVATSYTDNTPVIVFTGQVATSDYGKGTFQDSTKRGVDAVSIFDPITKSSSMILSRAKAEDEIRDAIRTALSGRRGPVHLSLPKDVVGASIQGEVAPPPLHRYPRNYFDRGLTIEAAQKLVNARSPAMLVGSGAVASNAGNSILELAELLGIPVATTPKAKGAFPEDHPLSLGVLGLCGSPLAESWIKSGHTDVLLVVGASLNQMTTLSWDPRLAPTDALIQVNIDPEEIGKNYRVDLPLVGDAMTVIDEIAFRVLRFIDELGDRKPRREQEVAELRAKVGRYLNPETMTSEQVPIHPARLIKDLEKGLPENAILFSDTGNHTDWAIHYLCVKRPGAFIAPFGMLPMGYATAAAVGGKFAAPDRPVVALVGDGCFMMNGMEVATAVDYNMPVIWVVMNNAKLGMAYDIQKLVGIENPVASHFRPVNIARVAEGYDAVGIRITKPGELAELLPKAVASGRPTVFDCVIARDAIPPLAPYLEGQKAFMKRLDML